MNYGSVDYMPQIYFIRSNWDWIIWYNYMPQLVTPWIRRRIYVSYISPVRMGREVWHWKSPKHCNTRAWKWDYSVLLTCRPSGNGCKSMMHWLVKRRWYNYYRIFMNYVKHMIYPPLSLKLRRYWHSGILHCIKSMWWYWKLGWVDDWMRRMSYNIQHCPSLHPLG